MNNLALFLITVAAYTFLYYLYKNLVDDGRLVFPRGTRSFLKTVGVVITLSLPFNINGYVFTMFGNVVGEKGVFSIASLYQKSDGNALSVFAPLTVQEAKGSAHTFFGVSSYQKGRSVFHLVGVSIYQQAEVQAGAGAGIGVVQRAGERTRYFGAIVPLTAQE